MNDLAKEEYIHNDRLDLILKCTEDNNRYNSTVCSIGYISLLAVLCYTHKYLDTGFLIWICIFYLISVAIFVGFEMTKIFLNNKYHENVLINLAEYEQNKINKSELIDKNLKSYASTYAKFEQNWFYFFIISAISGALSGILIILDLTLIGVKNIIS